MSRIDWDKQPLGKLTDREIADELGVTLHAVHYQRVIRGIPVCTRKPKPASPAKKLPHSNTINWREQPLGKKSDMDLAADLGVSKSSVYWARRILGVEPFREHSSLVEDRVDWSKQPLGRMPDEEIAKQLGIGVWAVTKARQRRKIVAFKTARSRAVKPINLDLPQALEIALRIIRKESTVDYEAASIGCAIEALQKELQRRRPENSAFDLAKMKLKQKASQVSCLLCQRKFRSPDKKLVRLCKVCKHDVIGRGAGFCEWTQWGGRCP